MLYLNSTNIHLELTKLTPLCIFIFSDKPINECDSVMAERCKMDK